MLKEMTNCRHAKMDTLGSTMKLEYEVIDTAVFSSCDRSRGIKMVSWRSESSVSRVVIGTARRGNFNICLSTDFCRGPKGRGRKRRATSMRFEDDKREEIQRETE